MKLNKNTYEIYSRSEGIKNKIVRPFLMLMGKQDIVQLFTQKGLISDATIIKRWEEALNFQVKAGEVAKLPAGYMEQTSALSNSIQSIVMGLGLGIDIRRASAYAPRYRQDGDLHQTDFVNIMHMILDIERHGTWLINHLSNPAVLSQNTDIKYVLRISHTNRTQSNLVSKYTYEAECDTFQDARAEGKHFIVTTLEDIGGLLQEFQTGMNEAPKLGNTVRTVRVEHNCTNENWKQRQTVARIEAVAAVSDNAKKFK